MDKYQYLEIIGQGGMGIVLKAKQLLMDNVVAIKILQTNFNSPQAVRRFQEEARTTIRLTHQNIVAMRDCGVSQEGYPYMVMDYLVGTTLKDAIEKLTYVPEALLLPVLKQICDALAYTHDQGVCHRDIKPANIMLSSLDSQAVNVKLMDFGIAKRESDGVEAPALTQTGETLGSPLYMSPEQIAGGKVDGRSDLYSLGCVIFECLTSVPPFQADTAIATCSKHLTDPPPTLREASLGKKFSKNWELLVARLLQKKPDDRLPSAAELKRILKQIQRGEEIDFSGLRSTTQEKNKSRVAIAVAATLLIATIGVAGFTLLGNQSDSNAPKKMTLSNSVSIFNTPEDKATNLAPADIKLKQMETLFLRHQGGALDENHLNIGSMFFDESTLVAFLKKHPDVNHILLTKLSITLNTFDALPKTRIRNLEMEECEIDEKGLARVNECPELTRLNLNRVTFFPDPANHDKLPTGDEALALLAGSKLQELKIENWQISESGAKLLMKFPDLGLLTVSGTAISPADLEMFTKHRWLHMVRAFDCPAITVSAEKAFVKKHPNFMLETAHNEPFLEAQKHWLENRTDPKKSAFYNGQAITEMKRLGPPYTEVYPNLIPSQLMFATVLLDQEPGEVVSAVEPVADAGSPTQQLQAKVLSAKALLKLGKVADAARYVVQAKDVLAKHSEIVDPASREFLSHVGN